MKKNRKAFIAVEIVLAFTVLVLAYFMVQEKNKNGFKKVSVVIQNSDDSQWTAFKYGLKMAAEDENIELSVISGEDRSLLEEEIEKGADGIILQPTKEYSMEDLKQLEKRIPLMLLEEPILEEAAKVPVTEADHYDMGKTLAEELLQDYSGNIEGKNIGVVLSREDLASIQKRKLGFEEGIKEKGADVLWEIGGNIPEATGEKLKSQKKADIVVAFDDESLIAAGECAASNDLWGAVLYGIGNSMHAVYYLDTRSAECIIVPDDFNVGYQSLSEMARSLNSPFGRMKSKTLSYNVLRQEDLFSEENQKLLFIMNQ